MVTVVTLATKKMSQNSFANVPLALQLYICSFLSLSSHVQLSCVAEWCSKLKTFPQASPFKIVLCQSENIGNVLRWYRPQVLICSVSVKSLEWLHNHGSSLKKLEISIEAGSNKNSLSTLKNLTCLICDYCSFSFDELKCLSQLTSLTKLDISYSFKKEQNTDEDNEKKNPLELLCDLSQMEVLKLNYAGMVGNKSIGNISVLSNMVGLRKLVLRQLASGVDLLPLLKCKHLTKLSIPHHGDGGGVGKKINFLLAQLNQLVQLDLSWCGQLTTLKPLEHLTNLQKLRLDGLTAPTLHPLLLLTNMVELSVSQMPHITTFEPLRKMHQLKILEAKGCSALTKLGDIKTLSLLETLGLTDCHQLESIDILRYCTNLTVIKCARCFIITSIDAFAVLQNLKHVNIVECNAITNIRALFGLSKLQHVWLPDFEVDLRDRRKVFSDQIVEHTGLPTHAGHHHRLEPDLKAGFVYCRRCKEVKETPAFWCKWCRYRQCIPCAQESALAFSSSQTQTNSCPS